MSVACRVAVEYLYLYLILAGCLLFTPALPAQSLQRVAAGQVSPADQKTVIVAMTKLKAGQLDLSTVRVLGRTGTVEAVPFLEKEFVSTTNPVDKALLAAVLVQLKDTDNTFWDYLANSVEHGLNIDEPDLFAYDAQGKLIPGPSSDFKGWAKRNGLDETQAEQDVMWTHPAEVLYLGITEDRRAIPLLRRALGSRNYLIEAAAALGLTAFGDSASVPLIVHAASIAPAGPAEVIAQCLVYFDDPDAQQAFELFVPKKRIQGLREAKAKGMPPLP